MGTNWLLEKAKGAGLDSLRKAVKSGPLCLPSYSTDFLLSLCTSLSYKLELDCFHPAVYIWHLIELNRLYTTQLTVVILQPPTVLCKDGLIQ